MDFVGTLVRQHDYLLLSRPICRRGPGWGLSGMFDTRPSSLFRVHTQGLPRPLYEGGGTLAINDCRLDAVMWQEGNISVHCKPSNVDAISFDFSGCVMAVFCFRGTWYAAHIHMGGAQDCTLEWIHFMRQMRPHLDALGMFRPNASRYAALPSDLLGPNSFDTPDLSRATRAYLWGVVTATGRFISLCVYPLDLSFRRFTVLFVEEHFGGLNPGYYHPLFRPFRSRVEAKLEWDNFWKSRAGRLLFKNY